MSWTCIPFTCSQAQAVESLQTCCSDTLQSLLVKSKSIPEEFCYSGNLTEFYRRFPFGTTLQRSEAITKNAQTHSQHGKESMRNSPSAAGSRNCAKTSVPPVKAQESPESGQDCGLSFPALSARFDRATSSWRIHPCLFPEDSTLSSPTLPKWGTMRSGELWERGKSERLTKEIESGLWPTPRAGKTTNENQESWERRRKAGDVATPPLSLAVKMWPTPTAHNAKECNSPSEAHRNEPSLASIAGGQLNPTWVELLMGWPANWTALDELCTGEIVGWGEGWEDGIPRVTTKTANRANRLKAIGNGQVPLCAATAWRILKERLDS